MSMATNLCKMVTYLDGLQPIKSNDFFITGLARSRDKLKLSHLHNTGPMATKLGWIMTYLEELLTIKSFNPLIMWSFKIMR